MSVGITAKMSAANINDRLGQLVVNLREALEDVSQFKRFVDLQFPTDVILKAFMTYDDADAALFRSIVSDLENLRLTAIGQRAQPGASNFFFNADKAAGFQ